MATEQEKTGRCGWVALGFMIILLQGILPGSFFGGLAGLQAANALTEHIGSADLIKRLLVLLGMIVGLLTAAAAVMFVTMAAVRIMSGRKKSALAGSPYRAPADPSR
ncbi:MAG: hypothetical protein A2010_13865 [Nitrospirae bacterium GWD2_57_9]|nr:MAG: hypothetical protein A2010_13865 [Nitrospirae bacterium GWD2_57_9]OGW46453.1 MAG: hypothetical protein A2078_02790 [Nitrospirae bacterium GWC2_57_9]